MTFGSNEPSPRHEELTPSKGNASHKKSKTSFIERMALKSDKRNKFPNINKQSELNATQKVEAIRAVFKGHQEHRVLGPNLRSELEEIRKPQSIMNTSVKEPSKTQFSFLSASKRSDTRTYSLISQLPRQESSI